MKQLFEILWCPEFGRKEHLIAAIAVMAFIISCLLVETLMG
jgi:hypothetical protein